MSKPKKTFPIVECFKHGLGPCDCGEQSRLEQKGPEQQRRDRRRSYTQRARARAKRGNTTYSKACTPHPALPAAVPAASSSMPPASTSASLTPSPTSASPPTATPASSAKIWTYEWVLGGEDISHDILNNLYHGLVEAVHAEGIYPAGFTEFEELVFSNVDLENGTAEFSVEFGAEHWSEDGINFPGTVDGSIRFITLDEDDDDDRALKERLLESLEIVDAKATFKMD